MRKERPKLVVVADYMEIDGELVQIDPFKTNLPDRCKLAYAEMMTGIKHVLVKIEEPSGAD